MKFNWLVRYTDEEHATHLIDLSWPRDDTDEMLMLTVKHRNAPSPPTHLLHAHARVPASVAVPLESSGKIQAAGSSSDGAPAQHTRC